MADDVVLPDFIKANSDPSFTDSLGASFRRQNLVGSALSSDTTATRFRQFVGMEESTPITDDEINREIEAAGLAQHVEAFADVGSREEFNAVMSDVLQEQEDMRISSASGWMGVGTDLIAGVVDLPTLLPVGAGFKVGKAANSVLGSAARLMGASALETTLTEVGLHATQQTRTLEESAFNVGGSVVLSSLLGAGVARATMGRTYGKIANQLEADMAAMAKNEPKLLANQKSDAILEELTRTAPTIPVPPKPVFGAGSKATGNEILDADNLSPSQRIYANSLGVNTVNRYAQMIFGRSIIHEMMAAEAPTARQFIQEVGELGSNVISSIADTSAIMLRNGPVSLVNFWGRRLSNMVKNGSFKVDRADLAREARAAGIAIEQEVQSRVAAQMDLMDPAANAVAGHNKFQQVSRYLAQAGSKVYLINSWTNAMRRAAFGIYQDRVIRYALDRTSMTPDAQRWLADLGLSSKHLDRIADQAKKGGAEGHMGVWLANTDKWDDDEIRSIFWAAGRKEVNTANVAPSALEKPRAFQNQILNTLLQFTSFAFASTSRVLGQSAQRIVADGGFGRDSARVYMGLSAMVGIGMLSGVLHNAADTWYQRATGQELTEWEELPDYEANPGFWVYQGISRSGTLGLFSQFADVFENATGYGPMGLTQSVFGDEEDLDPVSRYGQAQPLKNVFGPTAGLANDVITGVFDLTRQATDEDEDLKQKTARKLMRNFMPLLNAFYLKSLTKEATRQGLEAMGLEE